MEKKIIVGSDHAGFELKEAVLARLQSLGYTLQDLGVKSLEPADFPLIAETVCQEVVRQKAYGILICASGLGMCIVANKIDGIRAAHCESIWSAREARERVDVNVLCLGGRSLGRALALSIVETFLHFEFLAEERYQRRLAEITELETRN
ncbi:MAG: RpiB/LacA/LacB family sugar-phosphate isomerase [Candidatus Sungiibacteriota bacterium]|uniref:RpiB/LacA/LacB family sugar-phosphate isomerase n=1 Tax=Candidatus Sungiibacteriota bacterium TaxID=2750080 RepID=A0A7T5RJP7_9BACT|nr:MAG: RpiB/LacA/LacB family sugar-phosphate isomerase [Candidatus Sungbacteria bacterium]